MRGMSYGSIGQKLVLVGFWTAVWFIYLKEPIAPTTPNTSSLPIENVVYVKTHKTASSSIYKILYKLRDQLGRMPKMFPAPFFGGYPAYFKKGYVMNRDGEATGFKSDFQSLVGHFRYAEKEIESIMDDNPKYITIVRNPISVFESSFQYYYGHFHHYTPQFSKITCFGAPYLQVTGGQMRVNISTYIEMAEHTIDTSFAWFFRSKNGQSFDLGMDPELEDKTLILDYVNKLDSKFDLVLVTDYYLESLVLLKEKLNMEWHHLLIDSTMVGSYKKHNFTEKEKSIVRNLNKQDHILFEHFNQTLWRKVEKYGKHKMKKDVETLKQLIEEFRNRPKPLKTTEHKNISRKKRDVKPGILYIPHENRQAHIERLIERIEENCQTNKFCGNNEMIQNLAEDMYENQGWCPH